MTEDYDRGLTSDVPGGDYEATLEELDVQNPVERAAELSPEDAPTGALPLAGGGLLLVSALRSAVRGQLRAIPKALVGVGLVRYGLGKRGSGIRSSTGLGLRSDDESSGDGSTFDPSTDVEGVEGGTEDKDVSDAAAEAAGRPDFGRQSEIDADEEIDESRSLDEDEDDGGSEIEFTEEADGPKAELEGEDDDPRRDTPEEDEDLEIDVSDAAMADEASEATGPDPEQAQPAQTDSVEPDETPEEDASHMKVEPDDEEDIVDGTDEETAESEGESGEDDETEE